MPFRSEAQRRWLWRHEPKVAKRWTRKYGAKIVADAIKYKRRKKKHG